MGYHLGLSGLCGGGGYARAGRSGHLCSSRSRIPSCFALQVRVGCRILLSVAGTWRYPAIELAFFLRPTQNLSGSIFQGSPGCWGKPGNCLLDFTRLKNSLLFTVKNRVCVLLAAIWFVLPQLNLKSQLELHAVQSHDLFYELGMYLGSTDSRMALGSEP